MNKALHCVVTILLLVTSCNIMVQQGPIINCNNCLGLSDGPYPVQGNWYNPQQSGSGYLIDVQNGILSGFYFGYTDEGEPTWLSFSGVLQSSEETNINWQLEVPMTKISGGNAFNQPHQFPTNIEETGDVIKLQFHYAHYASVQINDHAQQQIIPINYGVESSQEFAESDHLFPELEGVWNFVLRVNSPDLLGLFAFSGHDIYIPAKFQRLFDDGTKRVSYTFSDWFFPESVNFASINCTNPVNEQTNERELSCELSNIPNIGDRMPVAPANIGPNYIYAENANGDVIEAFRVNYIPNFGNPTEGK